MLRKKDNISLDEFKAHGFKYGTRDKFIYKTKTNGQEASIYIDLLPCHNNFNELKTSLESKYIPDKILKKVYELVSAGLVEWVDNKTLKKEGK